MKTQKLKLVVAIVAIAFTTITSSCKKDKKNEPEEKDTDTEAAADQSFASSTVNDLTNIADEAGTNSSLSSFKLAQSNGLLASLCATVTLDSSAAPSRTITVNFGTTNCTCSDGRNRRGSLIITFTGHYRDSGSVKTITPVNYFVNDNQITGTKTITNNGHNAANHLVYSIYANIQVIKANGAGTIMWQSTRQREWLLGEATPFNWLDDKYSVTGNASGATANGNAFTSIITTALIKDMTCSANRKHFVSGVITHTPSGKATRTIDFGNGTCDDQATVTINGNTYNITLR